MSEFELATVEFQQATIAFQQASLEIAGRVNIPAYIAAIGLWAGIAVMHISNLNDARARKDRAREAKERARDAKEQHLSDNRRHKEVMKTLRQEREINMELIRRTSSPPPLPPAAGPDESHS